jgi:hypothetical protein
VLHRATTTSAGGSLDTRRGECLGLPGEPEIDDLIGRRDRGERESFVIGPSGSGKSSLIRAGRDRARVVTASQDGTPQIWDASTGVHTLDTWHLMVRCARWRSLMRS